MVASFPVADSDDIMLVTDGGKLIRIPVADIRIAGRNTQGVIVFKTGEGEKVVSAARLGEDDDDEPETSDGSDGAAEGATIETAAHGDDAGGTAPPGAPSERE